MNQIRFLLYFVPLPLRGGSSRWIPVGEDRCYFTHPTCFRPSSGPGWYNPYLKFTFVLHCSTPSFLPPPSFFFANFFLNFFLVFWINKLTYCLFAFFLPANTSAPDLHPIHLMMLTRQRLMALARPLFDCVCAPQILIPLVCAPQILIPLVCAPQIRIPLVCARTHLDSK